MDTTTYGYKIPRSPDTGEVFFPALEADIQQLNDHQHNGIDSAPLNALSLPPTTQAILSTDWGSALTDGGYKQTITLPLVPIDSIPTMVQLTYDAVGIEIRVTSTGERVYPKIVKNAASKYDIYVNDNSLALTAVYTS